MSARNSLSRKSARTVKAAEEIDTSKYDSCDLPELKAKREEEIAALNFEEVAIIDAAIAKFNTDNSQRVIEDLKASLCSQIDRAFQEYEEAVTENAENSAAAEKALRERYSTSFHEMKSRHISEIADLETDRALELHRQKVRPSARTEELKAKAKLLARNYEVQQAIEVRELAFASHGDELAQREFEVNQSYDRVLRYMNEKQSEEITRMGEALEKEIEETKSASSKFVEKQQKRVANVVRQALRKEISNGCKQLMKMDKWPVLSQELTDFIQKKLLDENRAFVFQAE